MYAQIPHLQNSQLEGLYLSTLPEVKTVSFNRSLFLGKCPLKNEKLKLSKFFFKHKNKNGCCIL